MIVNQQEAGQQSGAGVQACAKIAQDEATPAENLMVAALRDLAPVFVTISQREDVDIDVIDIALWMADGSCVAVECGRHDFRYGPPSLQEENQQRDRRLAARGWTVLRYSPREIAHDVNGCAKEALSVLCPNGFGAARMACAVAEASP